MKKINRRTFYQTRTKANGTEYILYRYEVGDEQGKKEEVDTLQEFEKDEEVIVWFDDRYNKPKLKKVCQKCGHQVTKGNEVAHEFCNISHT